MNVYDLLASASRDLKVAARDIEWTWDVTGNRATGQAIEQDSYWPAERPINN